MAGAERPIEGGYFNSSKFVALRGKQMLREADKIEDREPFVHLSLPYSDVREWIPEKSIYKETTDAFNLYRLAEIKSLSFLAYRYAFNPDNKELDVLLEFNHDRYAHSLVVALLTEKVLRRNGASRHTTNTGIVAGLLHDMATPALGDAVKFMDQKNLHEETHWQEMVTPRGYAHLKEHVIDPVVLDATIKNEGLLGKILDYTDRITYTMQDLHAVQVNYRVLPDQSYDDLQRVHQTNTGLGNIYRDIMIDQESGEPYFNDPGRLSAFLHTRALLYYNFYRNPLTAGRDWMISRFIKPLYTADPNDKTLPLNPKRLRQMTDNDLMRFLTSHYIGTHADPHFFYHEMTDWAPDYELAGTIEEAEQRATRLSQRKDVSVFGIYDSDGFNPATSYLTKDDHGNIVPVADAMPDDTEQLDDIADATKGIYVFYVDIKKPTQLNQLIRQVTTAA